MGKHNPFLSKTYGEIWLKHFNKAKSKSVKNFSFISELSFVKHRYLSLYHNVGKTLTKGVDYTLEPKDGFENKTFVIYDVPTYFKEKNIESNSRLRCYKSKQYPGFLIETEKFEDLNDYMLTRFSKNSRNKQKKYRRRLENSFKIQYKMFFGDISKSEYDFVFNEFKNLLVKRFDEKKITNNNLNKEEWDFYYEVAYPLILQKKASLFVVYNNDKPIGVTLCYFSEDILFDAITVFDIDYYKFHLGSITIMKLIEWCTENAIRTLDFSKGYFDYKTRWCTKTYDFEYHIYYDNKSLKSKMLAYMIKQFYDFKQYLRDKSINEKLHRLTYKLKGEKQSSEKQFSYNFSATDVTERSSSLDFVDIEGNGNNALKLMVYDFLYLYEEHYDNVKLFSFKSDETKYLITGNKNVVLADIKLN